MDDRLAYQVDLFAELMVRLNDVFSDRSLVLSGAGLDEERYLALVSSWQVRFGSDATGDLVKQFAGAYAMQRTAWDEERRARVKNEAAPTDLRFLNADAKSFREEAARVAQDPLTGEKGRDNTATVGPSLEAPNPAGVGAPPAVTPQVPSYAVPKPAPEVASYGRAVPASLPLAWASPAMPAISSALGSESVTHVPSARPAASGPSTAVLSAYVPKEILPFAGGAASSSVQPPLVDSQGSTPPNEAPARWPVYRKPPASLSGTADLPLRRKKLPTMPFSRPPVAATPPRGFGPPAPPPGFGPPVSVAPPQRRLIRFDPQTGQPLAEPTWVDFPGEPEGQKR